MNSFFTGHDKGSPTRSNAARSPLSPSKKKRVTRQNIVSGLKSKNESLEGKRKGKSSSTNNDDSSDDEMVAAKKKLRRSGRKREEVKYTANNDTEDDEGSEDSDNEEMVLKKKKAKKIDVKAGGKKKGGDKNKRAIDSDSEDDFKLGTESEDESFAAELESEMELDSEEEEYEASKKKKGKKTSYKAKLLQRKCSRMTHKDDNKFPRFHVPSSITAANMQSDTTSPTDIESDLKECNQAHAKMKKNTPKQEKKKASVKPPRYIDGWGYGDNSKNRPKIYNENNVKEDSDGIIGMLLNVNEIQWIR